MDAPFDIDGDGYFDANNHGCADTYAADALDCDEGHAEVHPGAAEVACNGLDDDCDAATPDAEDVDGDGFDSCEDCDDDDAAVSPDAAEIECNDLDDDCDPVIQVIASGIRSATPCCTGMDGLAGGEGPVLQCAALARNGLLHQHRFPAERAGSRFLAHEHLDP